jgi:hypothetical protein
MAPGSNSVIDTTTKVRLPRHVVYRPFAAETVVLNLETGLYHGLNSSAGTMLAALERLPTVAEAAKLLADRYDVPAEQIERDLLELCSELLSRGLIELVDVDAGG